MVISTVDIHGMLDEPDARPPKDGWAPGTYMVHCLKCGAVILGDKRAFHCAPCAYGDAYTGQLDAMEKDSG